MKTGHRLDGMMYSCSSLGIKIGGALGTAICGWLLDAAGYIKKCCCSDTGNYRHASVPIFVGTGNSLSDSNIPSFTLEG